MNRRLCLFAGFFTLLFAFTPSANASLETDPAAIKLCHSFQLEEYRVECVGIIKDAKFQGTLLAFCGHFQLEEVRLACLSKVKDQALGDEDLLKTCSTIQEEYTRLKCLAKLLPPEINAFGCEAQCVVTDGKTQPVTRPVYAEGKTLEGTFKKISSQCTPSVFDPNKYYLRVQTDTCGWTQAYPSNACRAL